ncbi:hypothetical protein BASA81_012842 [Batrachochytrium salamandrivorans]|nr:hypothetical protein BASA81_012842 [Batrachochytrium salamandrivorans]
MEPPSPLSMFVAAAMVMATVAVARLEPPPPPAQRDLGDDYLDRRERFLSFSSSSLRPNPLPCCLVTGEFGSGKTSLIKHLLEELKRENFTCGVIVNDFCDLAIDVSSLKQVNSNVYGFSDHCVCCLAGESGGDDELRRQIDGLSKLGGVDVLLIEMNGLSQVSRAIGVVSSLTRLDSVVGVVDAGNTGAAISPRFAEICDVICLNKASECTLEELGLITRELLLSTTGSNKLEIIQTNWGRIPIHKAFRVQPSEFVAGQMSVTEARQSRRFELVRGDYFRSTPVGEDQELVHDVNVKWKLLTSDLAMSLRELQQRIHGWHQSIGLRRIKGRVCIEIYPGAKPESYEFQFSGRARLQCTKLVQGISSQTRLAVVSTEESDLDLVVVCSDTEGKNDDYYDLDKDVRLTGTNLLSSSPAAHVVQFQITCERKFGFSRQTLLQRFGLDLDRVNRDFHDRFNAAPGPELVAFDGENLFACRETLTTGKFNEVLQSIVDLHFALVKLACKCDV